MLMSLKEFISEKSNVGTYAAMNFDAKSVKLIQEYMNANSIPNPLVPEKLHVTLLYSRKECVGYVGAGKLDKPYQCGIKGFEVWDTQGTEPKKALVAKLDCPELVERHKFLMNKFGGTYDFPSYVPHFTLSYDVGNFDKSSLPKFDVALILNEEYNDELKLDWAKDSAKEESEKA